MNPISIIILLGVAFVITRDLVNIPSGKDRIFYAILSVLGIGIFVIFLSFFGKEVTQLINANTQVRHFQSLNTNRNVTENNYPKIVAKLQMKLVENDTDVLAIVHIRNNYDIIDKETGEVVATIESEPISSDVFNLRIEHPLISIGDNHIEKRRERDLNLTNFDIEKLIEKRIYASNDTHKKVFKGVAFKVETFYDDGHIEQAKVLNDQIQKRLDDVTLTEKDLSNHWLFPYTIKLNDVS